MELPMQPEVSVDGSGVSIPAIPLPEAVVLPGMIVPLHLEAWAYVRSVETALLGDKRILLIPRRNRDEEPLASTVGKIGLIATVEESRPSRRGGQRVVVRGVERAEVRSVEQEEPFWRVVCEPYPDVELDVDEEDARELMHQLFAIIENLVELNPNVPSE